jgi:hypothetical protein
MNQWPPVSRTSENSPTGSIFPTVPGDTDLTLMAAKAGSLDTARKSIERKIPFVFGKKSTMNLAFYAKSMRNFPSI